MERLLNDEEDANDSIGLEYRPRERILDMQFREGFCLNLTGISMKQKYSFGSFRSILSIAENTFRTIISSHKTKQTYSGLVL